MMTNEQRILKAACDAITNVRLCRGINLDLADDTKLVRADNVMFEAMLSITTAALLTGEELNPAA
jgi:hypothetical protein